VVVDVTGSIDAKRLKITGATTIRIYGKKINTYCCMCKGNVVLPQRLRVEGICQDVGGN